MAWHEHDIFVKASPDKSERQVMVDILSYIDSQLPNLNRMKVRIRVHKLSSEDLKSPKVRTVLAARGITSLPALVTPKNTYMGVTAIKRLYEDNLAEFVADHKQQEPEDPLTSFYAQEMAGPPDDDEKAVGDSGEDMMRAYNDMVRRRQVHAEKGKPPAQRRPPHSSRDDNVAVRPTHRPPDESVRTSRASAPAAHAPAPASASRTPAPAAREPTPLPESDDEISASIRRIADNNDIPADEGGPDRQGSQMDDLMEQAYWRNQGTADV